MLSLPIYLFLRAHPITHVYNRQMIFLYLSYDYVCFTKILMIRPNSPRHH